MSGEALAHGVTPPWCLPTVADWEDLADDFAAAKLLGIPLADFDVFEPAARPACVPPAAIPLRRPDHYHRRPQRHTTRSDQRKENHRAAA